MKKLLLSTALISALALPAYADSVTISGTFGDPYYVAPQPYPYYYTTPPAGVYVYDNRWPSNRYYRDRWHHHHNWDYWHERHEHEEAWRHDRDWDRR